MSEKPKSRKSRCPLSLHPTGQWYKKIKGKFYYFGTDKQEAIARYLKEATSLHAGQPNTPRISSDGITVKELANRYLTYQQQRMDNREITAVHFWNCQEVLDDFLGAIGGSTPINTITAETLLRFRSSVVAKSAPTVANRLLTIVKALFNYGTDVGLIDRCPPTRKPLARVSIKKIRQHKADKKREHGDSIFTPEQIRMMLDKPPVQLKAMILLGINGGFGNSDIADLRRADLNLKDRIIDYNRVKTSIRRTVPLWPETVTALEAVLASRPKPVLLEDKDLVFVTPEGHRWVRVRQVQKESGLPEITKHDEVNKQLENYLKRLKIKRPGLSFYSLRHTHATFADRSKDVHAQKRIMGHAIPGMLGDYIEDIERDRLRAVVDVVHKIIFEASNPVTSDPGNNPSPTGQA